MRKILMMSLAAAICFFMLWPGTSPSALAESLFSVRVIDGTHCAVTGYTGNEEDVVIPGEIGGRIVQNVDEAAFAGNTGIVSVSFPDSVKTIGPYAFMDCTRLSALDFGAGLETLCFSCFSGCASLTSAVFPEGLQTIEANVFAHCPLERVILPDTVTALDDSSIERFNMKEFRWSAGLPEIYDNYFNRTPLEKIVIPEGVTSIGSGAFANCGQLTEVQLPGTVTDIKESAFSGCVSLTEITLPPGLETIHLHAFESCTSLKSVVIPSGVTVIQNAAFFNCTALEHVRLSSELTAIEDSVFGYCSSLTEIDIPDSAAYIGTSAFTHCTGLESVAMGSGVKSIGQFAFECCYNLSALKLGSGLETIGYGSFGACYSLASVDFPEGLQSVGYGAFNGCPLERIILPDTVTSLDQGAFSLGSAKEFRWSAGVASIPSFQFSSSPLESVVIPEGVTSIDVYAFLGCDQLERVQLPVSISSIGENAFANCPNLVLRVTAGSYGEAYAVSNNIDHDYKLNAYNALTVRLSAPSPIANYAGTKLWLLQNGERKAVITLNGGRREYEFADIAFGDHYALRLETAQGDVLASLDELSIQKKEAECNLYIPVGMAQASVRILDGSGQDVTERVMVKWYDRDALVSSGQTLSMQPVGKEITVKLSLPAALLPVYSEPAEQAFTVKAAGNALTVELEPLPRVTVTGRVTSQETGEGVEGAVVSVEQPINERYTYRTQAKTDGQGRYALELADLPYTLIVKKSGFAEYRGNPANGAIALHALAAQRFTLNIAYYTAGDNGAETGTLDTSTLRVTVTDAATGERKRAVLEYPRVLLPQSAAGDSLRVTLSSSRKAFAPVETTVRLTGNDDTVSATLVQYGGARVAIVNSPNTKTLAALYDGQGKYISSQRTNKTSVLFPELKDGAYTALLMGSNSTFCCPPSLDMLAGMGLAEHTDYILQGFQASSGVMTSVTPGEAIPFLANEALTYVNSASAYTNKQSLVVGDYFTLRASAELVEEYGGVAQNLTWLIALPDGLHYVDGTAMAGKTAIGLTANGEGMYEAPANDPAELLRLCAAPTAEGTYEINVFLRFTLRGKTILQPVGSAQVEAKGLTFTAPYSVNSAVIPVRGTAAAGAMVYIYDGSTLVGQTQAKANGEWSAEATLPVDSFTSCHTLHVETQSIDDPELVVSSSVMLVRYSPENIQLQSVTMVNTAHPANSLTPEEYETVFDYTGVNKTVSYYRYWPSYPEFTFLISFSENDPERIFDVRLNIRLSNGTEQTKTAVYSPDQGKWMVTETFTNSDALPVQIGLTFSADNVYISQDLKWEMAVTIDNIDASTSADGNEAVYSVRDDDGAELASTSVSVETVSIEEWRTIETIAGFVQYDLDLTNRYYYSTQENGLGGTTTGIAMVSDTSATLIWETVDSPAIGRTQQYFEQLDQPEVRQLADGFRQSVTPNAAEATPCFPYSTDWADRLNGLYDAADEALAAALGVENRDALYDAAEKASKIKEIYDDVKSLMEHDISFGPSVDLDTVLDLLHGTARCADLYDNVRNSSLTPEQKYVMYVNGAAGLALTTGVSVAKGWLSTYMETGKGLAILNNGVIDIWLKAQLGLTHDEAEIERLLGRLQDNRDAYQAKIDNYEKYCQGFLDYFGDIPDKFYDYLGGYVRSRGNYCIPPIDSENKTPELDPSGIVYESVPENVLEGVKVTCIELVTEYDIYGDPYTYEREWDAAEYSQINPQWTGADGSYGWDVPMGTWRVRYEKEGYETAYSDWMVVPPPHFDVNVGMISYAAPSVTQARVYADAVEVTFSKYMRAQPLDETLALVIVNGAAVSGAWEWQDTEEDPNEPEGLLSLRAVFHPAQAISLDARVRVQISGQVASYAGAAMQEDFSRAYSVIPVVEGLEVAEELALAYNETRRVTVQAVPGTEAAGLRVQAVPVSGLIVGAGEEYVTLDENGRAEITLTGKAPGSTECQVILEGTEIAAAVKVTVGMPEAVILQVKAPTASEASGTVVPYGTEIVLSSGTPNAKIYYTLENQDGTSSGRTLYTAPIRLTQNAQLYAAAKKQGMDDSEVSVFAYTLDQLPPVSREYTFLWADGFPACEGVSSIEPPVQDRELTWSSTDETVVSAEDGKITLKRAGTADIVAYDGEYTAARYTVHVEAAAAVFSLPAGTQEIRKQAFSGVSALAAVRIPDGTREIGQEAFKSCANLRAIYIPGSVAVIGTDALADCHADLYIIGQENSAAQRYARSHGIPFFAIQ